MLTISRLSGSMLRREAKAALDAIALLRAEVEKGNACLNGGGSRAHGRIIRKG